MANSLELPDLTASSILPARKQRVDYKSMSLGDKKQSKPKSTPRFKVGDPIMTLEGPAIVHSIQKKGIIQVTWPTHHGVPPAAIYNIPAEDVWTQAEKPNLVYDSHGTRIHEVNLIDMSRVRTEMVDPNDVIGKVPADEILLP